MLRLPVLSRRAALALGLVLLPAAALAGMSGTAAPSDGPVRCEIRAVPQGGLLSLTALVEADKSVSGRYTLEVEGAGRGGGTQLSQGGPFTAGAGRAATLGSVTLTGKGALYDVSLDVTVNGRTVSCNERVGDRT
ncbi:curli-like amyloid fiber formation chaperone CsgH [Aureimonas sp. AU40]|uniref:curli-like amyloid fiber formation chaperone CsgH n=1 Tax=Aureimonas sp. AU40 TaxID=1637747 RepID=UPI000783C52C|nr:curli-like amyloid fiber formation chaperone CsgH [Aureimonas sp. AU40]